MKQPKIINLAILFAALFLINGCDKEPIEAESKLGTDLVMFNGSIYTVDETHSWAQAIAIKDGRIIYVGPDAGINEFLGADTQVIDLQNKMVMPGMQDVHIHPIMSGIQASTVDLSNFETAAEYRTVISNYANANPEVEWILGGGRLMAA